MFNLACSGIVLLAVSFLSSTVVNAQASQGFSTAPPNGSKLHGTLQQLISNEISGLSGFSSRGPIALQQSAPALEALPPIVEGGYVIIDAVAENNSAELEKELKALGMQNISRFDPIISGDFPVAKLAELENITTLQFVTNTMAVKNKGSVTSPGDTAMNANLARQTHSVTGEGVKIGVLSDSYDCLGGADAGIASGDLPADIAVLQEANCLVRDYTDEGRAMLEIVHDVAPDAALMFHTANGGRAAFANGIIDLANAGAQVIIDDIKYLNEPFFQDGIIAQAVDQVHQENDVSYFSSAGNSGRNAYASDYREMAGIMNFAAPGKALDFCLEVEVKPGQVVIPVLQWDQPFFSVTGDKGATTDLSMLMFQGCSPQRRVLNTKTDNVGADPVEMAFIRNSSNETLSLGIIVKREAGPMPGKVKLVVTGGKITDSSNTYSGSSYGHAVARGAMGVGASVYRNARPYREQAVINFYSAAGGAEILFDRTGQRLASPDVRQQPAIVGPDGVDTTFFGLPYDDNAFPNFFGTSASAPHVGAVAALMLEHNPAASAAEIYAALIETADDMDDPMTKGIFDTGYDAGTGYGFINAQAALQHIRPAVAALPEIYCGGRLATIVGTDGSDNLVGTPGDDVIVGLGGDDNIVGRGGNDIICGGDGHDWIYSSTGDDSLFGGEGNDYIQTYGGTNEMDGGAGSDRLVGGSGDDLLIGGADRDLLVGGAGNDSLIGDEGNDVAFGGPGQDTCDAEFLIQCE